MSATGLDAEARAFDRQTEERIAHGHVPDLRLSPPCDWFENNPWRRPAYVELDFGEQCQLILSAIRRYTHAERLRVLEVGCGPGYLSLELARNGLDVVGLDLSPGAVDVARRFADQDPWVGERGSLDYVTGDFLEAETLPGASFDAVVFLAALHHFEAQDSVMRQVRRVLRPGGLIVAHEPVRDRVDKGNAAFAVLLETVLAAGGHFFRSSETPETDGELDAAIDRRYALMKYEDEDGGKLQSENDNAAGHAEMYAALSASFEELEHEWRYAFFHEFIGGLRYDEDTNARMARFLREMDRRLVALDVLEATEFFFVGRL